MDTRRADSRVREGQDEGGRERHAVGDAGLRSEPAERRRSRRSRPLPADAARIQSDRRPVGGFMRVTTTSGFVRIALARRRRRLRAAAQQPPPPRLVTAQEIARGPAAGRLALADVRRQLHQPAAQPAHADHARQRQSARPAVDIPDRHARQFRDDLAPARQRPVRDRTAERGVGDRRADRPTDLALPPRAAG